MRVFALPLLVVCMLSGSVAGQTGPPASVAQPSALDKAAFEDYIRHLFVWGPQIKVHVSDPKQSESLPGFKEVSITASAGQASQQETFFVSNDGRRIVRGVAYDITQNPFRSDLQKVTTEGQPGFGRESAPVTLVIYSDFQCSFCREEAKVIRQQLPKDYPEQVRVYFKDFPLEQIHPWAKPAAIAGRCVSRQKSDAFWAYHDWIFEQQANITAENLNSKLAEWAKTAGLDATAITSCLETRATESEVNRSMTEARALGINSTPTMFVNGRRLVGQLPWPQLKQIIDHEIEYQKKHGGDKCCEVKLSTPLSQ
jgi:protein-disulfide isomerase